jgi:homoserine kinase type II
MFSDQDARFVLEQFTLGSGYTQIAALANHGGFSGASLWRVEGEAGPWCLRGWPEKGPALEHIFAIHRLMEMGWKAGLEFVPRISRSCRGSTLVEYGGRLWEVTTWMPGQAAFHQKPSRDRLAAACITLARLHDVWGRAGRQTAPCPAVKRRWDCLRQWQVLLDSGWRPAIPPAGADPVHPWAEQAWSLLPRHIALLADALSPWLSRPLPSQPCLCDVWHDHVLFEEDRVTALLDYGSAKMDHVAVDLARLLGSLVGDDTGMFAVGVGAYRSLRPLREEEETLVKVLDNTGTVLGAANWLRWLYYEQRQYGDRQAVARRLAALVERMESWCQVET